jgi:glutaredoxin
MSKIVLYATPGCPLCDQVRDFLSARGVAFEEVDVRSDPLAFHQMAVFAGGLLVPVIEFDGDVLVGFDRERLEEMVERAMKPDGSSDEGSQTVVVTSDE